MYTIFLLLFSFMVQNYFICFIKLLFLYFLFILYLLCSVSSLLSKLLYPRIAGCPYFHGYNLWGKISKTFGFLSPFQNLNMIRRLTLSRALVVISTARPSMNYNIIFVYILLAIHLSWRPGYLFKTFLFKSL